MAVGALTNEGKLLLQGIFASLAERIQISGDEIGLGIDRRDIFLYGTASARSINWNAPSVSLGLKMLGTKSYNVGTGNTPEGVITERNITGIRLLTGNDTPVADIQFPSTDFGQYLVTDDGSNGKYTVDGLTVHIT